MPTPQLNGRTKSRERPTYSELVWEQIQDTKTEVRETRKELNVRMDNLKEELNARIDNLQEELKTTRQELNSRIDKLDERVDKLSDKIDALHNEIKSSANHGQIATISTLGIALAVIYSLLSR